MREIRLYPRDFDTLGLILEIETYLGLKSRNIDKLSDNELHEYINQITLKLLML